MRTFVLLALVATSHGLALAQATYEEAAAAFQKEKYELAAQKFEELLAQSPTWAPGHVVLGQCYYLLDQAERAEASIRLAQELDPETDLFQAYFGAGHLLSKQKRFDQASRPLEKALEHAAAGQRESTSLRLAYSYLVADQHEKARRAIERHHGQFGVDFGSAYYLALACHGLGDYPCALQNLRAAKKAGGDEQEGRKLPERLAKWSYKWALLPENESRRGELVRQAVEDTRSWYEADPDNPTARRYYTETLLAAHRGKEVVRELLPAARRDEQDCMVRVILAKAFNSLEDGREAEDWAEKAANCDPSLAAAHVELATARIHQLRPEHSSLDEVRHDQSLIREALASLRRALDLDTHAHSRVSDLVADTQRTLERLVQVEDDFVAHDKTHLDDVRDAQLAEIRQRCESILWIVAHDARDLSPEEEAFYGEHDCKQYSRQRGGSD